MKWKDLSYWKSGEYQVVQERLNDLTRRGTPICPSKRNLFRALDLTPFEQVRVVLCGQDPYPDPGNACGIAFSVPPSVTDLPLTLANIFTEYEKDLGLPSPPSGDLTKWCERGVLLWNVYPSCTAGLSLSHKWDEWKPLTQQIIEALNPKSVIFVFLGNEAYSFAQYVDVIQSDIIKLSHPSPRGNMTSKTPFKGSRMFSLINDKLVSQGLPAINWRL